MRTWDDSEFHPIVTPGITSGLGIAEGGDLPDTVHPDLGVYTLTPVTMMPTFDMSSVQMNLEKYDETVKWATLVDNMGNEFNRRLNANILGNTTTVRGHNIESLPRMCSSYDEVHNCTDVNAGDADMWVKGGTAQIDRDAGATYADAYVLHNDGNDLAFTLDMLDDVIENCQPYWLENSTENKVFLCDFATGQAIGRLASANKNYDMIKAAFTVNGIKTLGDIDYTTRVAAYQGIPIIETSNMPDSYVNVGVGPLGDILLLDLDNVWIALAEPPNYKESDDYLALGKAAHVGSIHMEAELACTMFKCHGKIRDIAKAAYVP